MGPAGGLVARGAGIASTSRVGGIARLQLRLNGRVSGSVWPDGVFELLDGLFFDVDDYTGDAELRSRVGGIDEAELSRRTAERLSALIRLAVVDA